MTTKKIKTSDILGDNYYIYELTSSNYTPALNGTITITCTMKDVYGAVAGSKSITLYQNGTSKGSQTTNSNGVATWSITCSTAGLQKFNIKDTSIEVFVDNKEDTSNKLTSLNALDAHSTDTQYASAKLIHEYLETKEDASNKVTFMDAISTDDEYPSAKCVYDKIEERIDDIFEYIPQDLGSLAYEDNISNLVGAVALSNDYEDLDNKPIITVEKLATATSGYLSSYAVKQNGVQVGNTIDIPKDFLVKSGSVKTVVVDNHPVSGYSEGDRYIDFIINTKDNSGTDEHMYILVSDLVQDNGIEYINGTHSDTSTFIFTGNSYVFNSVSDIKDGSMIIYRVPVTSTNDSDNLKLQITCKGASGYGAGGSTTYVMKNNAHVTANQYPINTKLLLMYQNGWNIIGQTNLDDAYATANHTHNQYLTSHQDISGKEDISNKVSSWNSTTTDINYPSEKLVKDSLDLKSDSTHIHTIDVKGGSNVIFEDKGSPNGVSNYGTMPHREGSTNPSFTISYDYDEQAYSLVGECCITPLTGITSDFKLEVDMKRTVNSEWCGLSFGQNIGNGFFYGGFGGYWQGHYYQNNSWRGSISGGGTSSADTWYHLELKKEGTTITINAYDIDRVIKLRSASRTYDDSDNYYGIILTGYFKNVKVEYLNDNSPINLSTDKTVLSFYDNEFATLTTTYKTGAIIDLYDADTMTRIGNFIEDNGTYTYNYASTGKGNINLVAKSGSQISESICIEDCLFYGINTDAFDIPEDVTFSSDSEKITATKSTSGEKLVYFNHDFNQNDNFLFESEIAELGVYQVIAMNWNDVDYYGGQYGGTNRAYTHLTSSDAWISHTFAVGDKYTVIRKDETTSAYINNDLISSANCSYNTTFKVGFFINPDRTQYYKNIKIKIMNDVIPYAPQLKNTIYLGNDILNLVYPVGSIYMSVNSTSPATLFGGTWERLQNRFLIGAGDIYSNGATGGETTVTLTTSQMPSHTHTQNAHRHHYSRRNVYAATGSAAAGIGHSTDSSYEDYYTDYQTPTINSSGGGSSHNNMPPYLAVYMWKRTA